MAKKRATAEERKWMQRVSELSCAACGAYEVTVHHCRINTGMGVRPSHYDTIPLCHHHHQGAEGIHTIGKKTWEAKYGSQQDMLEKTKELLCTQ